MKKGKTKTSWLPPFISLKVKSKSNPTTKQKTKLKTTRIWISNF